jgi:tyrosine-protein phosphatase YwqE
MNVLRHLFKPKRQWNKDMDSRMKVDVHSHLIPGIDDGCKNVEQVMEILRELHSQGIEKVITTPHVIYDLYPNSAEVIQSGAEDVRRHLADSGLNLTFQAAAEYYIDESFMDRHIKKSESLLTLGDRYILTETNYIAKPALLDEAVFELKTMGYEVILAHPERYHYLLSDFSEFGKLKENGLHFQVNLMSFTGHYGPMVQKAAEHLLKSEIKAPFGLQQAHGTAFT